MKLFEHSMSDRDVGWYDAVATNEHGECRQRVRLEIAEHPRFTKRPDESYIMARKNGRIEARVVGVPIPEVKWYKNWLPLADTSRIKVSLKFLIIKNQYCNYLIIKPSVSSNTSQRTFCK